MTERVLNYDAADQLLEEKLKNVALEAENKSLREQLVAAEDRIASLEHQVAWLKTDSDNAWTSWCAEPEPESEEVEE